MTRTGRDTQIAWKERLWHTYGSDTLFCVMLTDVCELASSFRLQQTTLPEASPTPDWSVGLGQATLGLGIVFYDM